MLDQTARRHAVGLTRRSRSPLRLRDAGARRLALREPAPPRASERRRRPGTTPCPRLTFAPVAASRWAITPLTGRANDEQPLRVRSRRQYARRCTAPGWPRLRSTRALACSSAERASSSRFAGAAPALVSRSARSRSRVARAERRLRVSARSLKLRKIAGADGGGSSRASSCPRDTLAPSGTSTTRVRRPSIGATTSAAPPGLASRRAGTRIDSRTACSLTTAVPKSRLHCCSLRKLMPGASSPAPPAAARAASAFGYTSTSPTRCSSLSPLALQHDDELALARLRRASRRRRRFPDGKAHRRGILPAGPRHLAGALRRCPR